MLPALLTIAAITGLLLGAPAEATAQVPVTVQVGDDQPQPGAPGDGPSTTPEELPRTGTDAAGAVSLAFLLVSGGAVLIDASRRAERSPGRERSST